MKITKILFTLLGVFAVALASTETTTTEAKAEDAGLESKEIVSTRTGCDCID